MSKAKAKMTSKIISDYQSKIAEYIKKNEGISNEILDLKNSIDNGFGVDLPDYLL